MNGRIGRTESDVMIRGVDSQPDASVLNFRFRVPETRFINIYKHEAQASE